MAHDAGVIVPCTLRINLAPARFCIDICGTSHLSTRRGTERHMIGRRPALNALPGRQQSPADPNAPLRQALGAARDLVISISAFSACLNLLYIAPSLYMLQVYDRVVPTR